MEKEQAVNNKIYIICGPTSTGKTSLGIDLCKKFNGEIISADSRQVCKGMDIGTGKVPATSDRTMRFDKYWQIEGVKIWGYDLFSPDQYFSGVDWADFALKKSKDLLRKGKNVFVIGGTGFYIDLFTGYVRPSKVKPDFDLRRELENLNLKELQRKLLKLNPSEYKKVDKKNKVRLIRSIEKELSSEIRDINLSYLDNEFFFFGLTGPREFLYSRSDSWVDSVWNAGLIEETKILIKKFPESPKLNGLVYGVVKEFVSGSITEQSAKERIKYDIHAYIRRQQTYFKKNKEIKWVDISKDDFKQIIYNMISNG